MKWLLFSISFSLCILMATCLSSEFNFPAVDGEGIKGRSINPEGWLIDGDALAKLHEPVILKGRSAVIAALSRVSDVGKFQFALETVSDSGYDACLYFAVGSGSAMLHVDILESGELVEWRFLQRGIADKVPNLPQRGVIAVPPELSRWNSVCLFSYVDDLGGWSSVAFSGKAIAAQAQEKVVDESAINELQTLGHLRDFLNDAMGRD